MVVLFNYHWNLGSIGTTTSLGNFLSPTTSILDF
jgi:hypothetical protein